MSKQHGQRTYFIVGEGFVADIQSSSVSTTGAENTNEERAYRFSRMFPALPKLVVEDDLLIQLGKAMIATEESEDQNTNIPAGFTYLGQFIDHDMTFDQTEGIPDHQLSVEEIIQGRSPSLDLDSLYGRGPTLQPELYLDGARLQVGTTSAVGDLEAMPNDLLRLNANPSRAVIGDPRNDENLAVAQTHLAFIKFHNALVDKLQAQDATLQGSDLFQAARKLVVQHYQHIVLHDFLPRVVEKAAIDQALAELQQNPIGDNPAEPSMPIEFAAAAYRLGHSMVRQNYSWNKVFTDVPFEFLFLFSVGSGNLAGSKTLPSNWIVDWRRFYEIPRHPAPLPLVNGKPNLARKIDTSLASVLNAIPGFPNDLNSLPVRNLLRGSRLGLPSGQSIANEIGTVAVEPATLKDKLLAKGLDADTIETSHLHEQTPLWFYILAEAETKHAGHRLGSVGSYILAKTFVDLIAQSQTSILRGDAWLPSPMLINHEGNFDMAQFLLVVDDLNPLEPKYTIDLPLIFR